MTEVLFVLLIVYVVYVIQSVVGKKDTKKEPPIEVKPTTVAETIKQPEPKVVVEKAKPAPKKPTATKKVTAIKAKPVSGSLRNPKTGDVDKIATSYRMTKRWIKEALVTEGLLPKIYKTTEIDDAVKLKASQALAKLAKMDKYQ